MRSLPECTASLVGAGPMGREHLKCLRRQPGVTIVGVCDRQASLARMAADEFEVPRWFTDYQQMLDVLKPRVVHITTPAATHHALAHGALHAGAHVFVEKPATSDSAQLADLKRVAYAEQRWLIEDQNYLFNESCQTLLELLQSGEAGELRHLAVSFCADILGPGSPFSDPDVPHPSLGDKGGLISDFLPHLAYMTFAFAGPHKQVHSSWLARTAGLQQHDEFAALVQAERGTVSLHFSASVQPSAFSLRLYGTRLTAEADLLEPRLTLARKTGGPAGLMPSLNALRQAQASGAASLRSLARRLAGQPVALEGMWELIGRTYRALAAGGEPPVTLAAMEASTSLVEALTEGWPGRP